MLQTVWPIIERFILDYHIIIAGIIIVTFNLWLIKREYFPHRKQVRYSENIMKLWAEKHVYSKYRQRYEYIMNKGKK
jgi:hypothetical protein